MRLWLAIPFLFGATGTVMHAAEWTPHPLTNIAVPQVFQSARIPLRRPNQTPNGRNPSIFGLKAFANSNGNVLRLTALTTGATPVSDDDPPMESDITESEIVPRAYDESSHEEQLESTFPLPPSGPQRLSQKAVPLDGADRDEKSLEENDDDKKLSGSYSAFGWIAGSGNRLGMLELDFKPSSRVRFDPKPRSDSTVIDLEWGAKWLAGPNVTDLPPQLFNVLINVGQRFQVRERLMIDAMISPGWFTDFSNKGVEAFRLPWHLVSYYELNEDWYGVMGVINLARDDIQYLPVIGTVYAPVSGDVRLDLVFPKPRVAWKISDNIGGRERQKGRRSQVESLWLTLGGELGGGSWAISRADRAYDVVTYRDYRLIAGLESQQKNGATSRLEAGWIFDRSVQYRSNMGNYQPSDSFMVRVSTDY